MHTHALTETEYTPVGETRTTGGSPMHQDIIIHRSTLLSGELYERLDPIGYPQKGIILAGTVDGVAYPPPATALVVSAGAQDSAQPLVTVHAHSLPFTDFFQRPDGSLGAPWVNMAPTIYSPHTPTDVTLSSGHAVALGSDPISLAVVDVAADAVIEADFTGISTAVGNGVRGIAFRVQDSTHFFTAIQISTGELVVYKFAGGVVTVAGRTDQSGVQGTIRVEASGHSITASAPSTGTVTFTDSDYATASRHGLWFIQPTPAYATRFAVTPL